MARMEYDVDGFSDRLARYEESFRRSVRKEMVLAGAAVLKKETRNEIVNRGHVKTGQMRDSVAPTEVYEDVDGVSVEVYTQGEENEIKNRIINFGYYRFDTGRQVKKDPYLARMRKKTEPRVLSVMEEQLKRSLRDAGLSGES